MTSTRGPRVVTVATDSPKTFGTCSQTSSGRFQCSGTSKSDRKKTKVEGFFGKRPKMLLTKTVGDVTNLGILGLTVLYAVLSIGHGLKFWDLRPFFGQNWANDGFCVSFKGTLLQTHLLCFYGDAVLAVVCYLVARKSRMELRVVADSATATFMHGVAHAFIWYKGDAMGSRDSGILDTIVHFAGLLGFWRAFLGDKKLQVIFHSLMLYYVPPTMAFTYVNTVLFLEFTILSLLRGFIGMKDHYYALNSLVIGLPIMAATWAEPLLCDNGLVYFGGHILFDYTIPLSNLAYFAIARGLPPRVSSSSSSLRGGDDGKKID